MIVSPPSGLIGGGYPTHSVAGQTSFRSPRNALVVFFAGSD
jgi:hypothetical protein